MFRLDILKLTFSALADQHRQDFTEIKDDLDALKEGHNKLARISKFMNNIDDLDFSEDARSVARNGSDLQ